MVYRIRNHEPRTGSRFVGDLDGDYMEITKLTRHPNCLSRIPNVLMWQPWRHRLSWCSSLKGSFNKWIGYQCPIFGQTDQIVSLPSDEIHSSPPKPQMFQTKNTDISQHMRQYTVIFARSPYIPLCFDVILCPFLNIPFMSEKRHRKEDATNNTKALQALVP